MRRYKQWNYSHLPTPMFPGCPARNPAGEGARLIYNSLYLIYKKLCRYLCCSSEELKTLIDNSYELSFSHMFEIVIKLILAVVN
jgi:hypothetical protein